MIIPVLTPLTALLVTTPLINSAQWQIDLYQNDTNCPESGEAPSFPGTITLVGSGVEDCKGGPGYEDGGHDSYAVNIRGISHKNLIVKFYATEGCPADSLISTVQGDNCYVSGKFPRVVVDGNEDTRLGHGPLNFVKVALVDARETNYKEP
ncbi:MAG: hypothetical protein Q9167_001984 [Letrouitia subvulpina]